MRSLVVGASGLVGGAIARALGDTAVGTYRTRPRPGLIPLDASDAGAFAAVLRETDVEVIYLPAAEPNVEWCEAHPAEARALNLDLVRAALAVAGSRPIVAFSTDYVFDGRDGPYAEGHPTAPMSVYGRVKLELEELLLAQRENVVVRTTGVFGYETAPAKNFVLRLLDSLRRGHPVRVAQDQVANPTYAPDLARASIRIAASRRGGLWHVAGPDLVARTELARVAAAVFGLPEDLLEARPTSELGQLARRPLRSGLLSRKYEAAFGPVGRRLADALADLREDLAAHGELELYAG